MLTGLKKMWQTFTTLTGLGKITQLLKAAFSRGPVNPKVGSSQPSWRVWPVTGRLKDPDSRSGSVGEISAASVQTTVPLHGRPVASSHRKVV
ncbi:hypothetical protein ElyMa_002613500 [Elysia marginata]|uniref:Uncharacterized protein n=1 Tax=Elysia marginata TaxID=1093978 RepID=A0AAV4H3G1_9GAST|nr:hypothetical protein ElyMa_002613500 [Elysia marginata]